MLDVVPDKIALAACRRLRDRLLRDNETRSIVGHLAFSLKTFGPQGRGVIRHASVHTGTYPTG